MKHLISTTLLLLALLLPALASAHDFEVDGIYYNINGSEATVTYRGSYVNCYSGDVTIPATVTYDGTTYLVTAIGSQAFMQCSGLTSVTIQPGIISIGDLAFCNCSGLKSITLPSSLTRIGDSAFWLCSSLTSITIPSSVTSISVYAFDSCSGLTSIIVDSNNSVYDSRNDCNAIIKKSNNQLVLGCKNTIIPSSVTSIGYDAFRGCSGLTSITIPSSVTSIGVSAFSGCSGLTSITIPSSVTSIDMYAFSDCISLTSITIPSSVTSIGYNPFDCCSGLASIIVDSNNSVYDSRNDCNAIIEKCTNQLLVGCKNTIIPSSVTSIGVNAFYGCSGLMSITIPSGVISIGDWAFCDCRGLTSISIPSGVISIGELAFCGCNGLTSITIPSNVINIGKRAFMSCKTLDDVYSNISNPSQINMGSYVFYRDSQNYTSRTLHVPAGSLAAYQADTNWSQYFGNIVEKSPNIIFADANVKAICVEHWDTNGDGELSENEAAAVTSLDGAFCENEEITSFDEFRYFTGLTIIEKWAFYKCFHLTSITIPSSVTIIDGVAFNETGLTSIKIPSSVTSIEYFAFHGCSSLTSITIPSSVTNIGSYAFSGCSGLTSITIPSSVTSIGNYAFSGCSGLTSIIVETNNTVYDSRNNCNAIIEKSTHKLVVGCQNTIIPSSVISIGESAFNNRSGLTSIKIPSGVNSIGDDAFWDCSRLDDVYSYITDPSQIAMGENVFYRYPQNYTERTLHVPAGSLVAYQADHLWSDYFGSIVEMGPMVATSIELDRSAALMEPGEYLQLTADLQPIEAIYNEVLWGSSNPAVATVSSDGLVTALAQGTATITAMTTDGSNLSASCMVTVYIEMRGDVDGNGSVNISDVTSLIDYLLNGDASAIVLTNADCDGSGVVNISDVTELIDYLLSGSWPLEPEPEPVITPYTVNGITFNMVEAEGGSFMMGATPEQGDEVWDKEKPVHQVTLSGYHIGQTEVIQELWQAVMGENPSYFTGDLQRPVDQVSWVDCIAFISKLNQLTGKSFRLPTEAEWEYAARGGNKSEGYRYAGGNDMDVVSWYIDNSNNTTHPVATKAPNELGLYDMTGNVWEWCQDWYARYTADAQVDPTGKATGTNRVLRGGCWNGAANYNRISFRDNFTPTGSNSSGGLRLVLDMDNSPKFRLSETVMTVEMGGNKSVNILNGGGSYTVSGGADFVTASISGNQLTVTGNATGTTTVHVTDAATGAMAVIAVIVTEKNDEVFTVNGVTFKMVTVDEGIFAMGATAEQGSDYNSNERPTHQVALSGYKIGQTEVTQELWVAVMGSNPSNFTGNLQRPVDKVSYNDCLEFISKLNQLTGKSFRLPTEAEWEFAARGGNLSQGYKYAGSNTVEDVAWYLDNSESTTHPVATKAPNELVLYDMSGNVFEWCQDWYGAYSAETQVNPTGPTSGTYRVCRGGAWNYNSSYSRVSYRSYHSMTSQYNRIGLRLALD